jgi:hypothetical protein
LESGDKDWDPIAKVIELFKEHFGVLSVDKVRKLQTLRKQENETCRMLKENKQQDVEREQDLQNVETNPGRHNPLSGEASSIQ